MAASVAPRASKVATTAGAITITSVTPLAVPHMAVAISGSSPVITKNAKPTHGSVATKFPSPTVKPLKKLAVPHMLLGVFAPEVSARNVQSVTPSHGAIAHGAPSPTCKPVLTLTVPASASLVAGSSPTASITTNDWIPVPVVTGTLTRPKAQEVLPNV